MSLDIVNDKAGVERTVALYSLLMDLGRFVEWGELFLPDATAASIAGSSNPVHWTAHGRAEIVAQTSAIVQPLLDRGGVVHLTSNLVVDVAGDAARAWWDVVVLLITGEGVNTVRAGRYYTRLHRAGGRWLFASRTLVQAGAALPDDVDPVPAQ